MISPEFVSCSHKIIDGIDFANSMRSRLMQRASVFSASMHMKPCIAVIIVGEDPASIVYVSSKHKYAKAIGMLSLNIAMPISAKESDVLLEVEKLNCDPRVHGILVQLPLPSHIAERRVIDAIATHKDVDGLTTENCGKLSIGQFDTALLPCTPLGCLLLIKSVISDLSGKKALVIGASNIVGKPMACLLLHEKCTVTIAHSKTVNLKKECLAADIIVVAVGIIGLLTGDMIKDGSVIIDVGIHRIKNKDGSVKIIGDVDFSSCMTKSCFITPVPGGVGPMTIACLLQNTMICAERICNFDIDELDVRYWQH